MWDEAFVHGKKKKAGNMPRPPAEQWSREAWDVEGDNLLPLNFEVPAFLTERTADVMARCIDRAPEVRSYFCSYRGAFHPTQRSGWCICFIH